MYLEVITPEKTILKEDVDEVLVPTQQGQIGILPHHTNLVTELVHGEMIIKTKGKEHILAVTGGFLEVKDGKVTILADYAVHAEDIDVEKALSAQKRAEEVLKKKKEEISEKDFVIAQGELRRSLLELHIANRRRRKSPH